MLHAKVRYTNDHEKDGASCKLYDLAIIGAGPVGVKAALVAASAPYNKRVCIIDAPRESGMLYVDEKDLSIGGPTGLFSKALRDTSKRIKVDSLRGMGLREESVWNEIICSCVDLATLNADDVMRQMESAGVDYVEGLASFPDSGGTQTLYVCNEQQQISCFEVENVLIATGSKPFRPAGIPFDGKRIFDSDSINTLSYLPKNVAITGSGIIAIEFAKIFRNLGAEVSLIIRDRIPRNALMKIGLDKDIAATLVADLVRSGIKIEKGAQVKRYDVPQNNSQAPIKLQLEATGGGPRPTGERTEISCDCYLAAVGRKPNTMSLNLASVGIPVDDYGALVVDSNLRSTKAANVYGAGDVLGRPFLASTGVLQGVAAVQYMFQQPLVPPPATDTNSSDTSTDVVEEEGIKFDPISLAENPFAFPTAIWSSPEAAYYGLTEKQAKDAGFDAGEGVALYVECLRGLVFSPNGMLKLVYEKPAGRILGVHICGDDACELIHYGMELVKAKRTVSDVVNNLFSAVTYHEMYRIAALAVIDKAGSRKRRAAAGAALAARNRSLKQR